MTRRLAFLITAVAISAVSCGGDRTSTTVASGGFVVYGYAHSGPTCPVESTPPDPACDDRAVPGAVIIVRDSGGAAVAEISTRTDGTFSVTLTPGTYTFVPQPVEGLMGTAAEVEVIVVDSPINGLDFSYDTGIR